MTSHYSFKDFPPLHLTTPPAWVHNGKAEGALPISGCPSSLPTSAALCQPSPRPKFRALKCMVLEWGSGRGQGAGQNRSPSPAHGVAGKSSPKIPFASPSLCCLGHSRLCLGEYPCLQIPKHTKCYYHIVIVSLMCSAQRTPTELNGRSGVIFLSCHSVFLAVDWNYFSVFLNTSQPP